MISSSMPLARFIRMTVSAFVLLWCTSGHGAVANKIAYQGYFATPGGVPLDATVAMTLKLYNAPTGGSPLYIESHMVPVANGRFSVLIGSVTTLSLPFDVPYFLGITIEPDPEMTPRVELVSVPYAIRAASAESVAAAAALPGSQITGTIGTAQIAANAVTQSRLSPTTGAAPGKVLGTDGINLQWQNDANSGGTVTSVASGFGLSGGPITTTGTLAVDPSAIQRRITGTCAANAAVGSVLADGTVGCTSFPAPPPSLSPLPAYSNTLTNVATGQTASVPTYVSVVIGADGLPLIAYYDVTSADLKVYHCQDLACATGSVATIDSAGDVGKFNSITLDAAGLGAISYYDATAKTLKLARCANVLCSSATVSTIDATADVGQYSAIATNMDGRFVIAYHDATTRDLKLAYCTNATCSSRSLMVVDHIGDQGKHASMVVVGGKVFIAYFESPLALKLAVCPPGSCGNPTIRTLDNFSPAGLFTSIAISADNAPIVAYAYANDVDDFSAGGWVKVIKCNRDSGNTCATFSAPALIKPAMTSVPGTAIAVGADGMPVVGVAYNQLLRCVRAECGFSDITSPQFQHPTGGNVATKPALVIGADGMPLMVYGMNGVLGVIHCGSRDCSAFRR